MGLISWIKGKYYDSRLDKADRLVSENSLDQAEEIYRSLLGNQDLAIVHLADMFVSHSQGWHFIIYSQIMLLLLNRRTELNIVL